MGPPARRLQYRHHGPGRRAPFGAIENGAIGIQDGRIVRVGRRTELAGYRAKKVEPLDGAWVTPGLVDCHTHLVFAGDRAGEFEQRLEGASYEEIARAGGGIAATVKATRAASLEELVEASRPRLRALMAGGVTTVEIKSGYGLDIETELKMLQRRQGARRERDGAGRADLAGAARAAAGIRRPARGLCRGSRPNRMLPAAADQGLASAVDAFCEGIGFTPDEVARLVRGRARPRPARQAPRRAAQQSRRRGACRRLWRAVGRPSRTCSTRREWRRWRGPAWWRCCCPAPIMR